MLITNKIDLHRYINANSIFYFRPEEFYCPCCKQVKIETDLIDRIEALREDLGTPVKITSAYRCPDHNKAIGGSPTSSHLKGLALDISIEASTDRYQFLRLAFKYFKRIGIAKNFIHVDIDTEKVQNVVWLYS